MPLQNLLNRTQPQVKFLKGKSNYVQKPILESGFEGLWRYFQEEEEAGVVTIIMVPYGRKLAEIPESAIPFPHRAGNLYMISHIISWGEETVNNSDGYLSFSRRVEDCLTPYVSSNPWAAYLNYRDMDIGVNSVVGKTSYARASVWGMKYFKINFNHLVRVKTMIDPHNLFRNEQIIPPLHSKWNKGD